MLIKDGKIKPDNFTPAPIQPHAAVKKAPELKCKTLPDGTDGREIPTPEELMRLAQNPLFRELIGIFERQYGCETGIRRMVRTQLKHDRIADMGIRTQIRAIKLGQKKALEKRRVK
jgi:hypothetical protein